MKQLRIITGILTAVLACTAAGLALGIYLSYSGSGQMYTAELVCAKLRILRIPAFIWLVAVLAAAVAELRQPLKQECARKAPVPAYSRSVRLAALAAAATACVWMLAYLTNAEHFASRNLEYAVGMMLLNIFPCAAILLGAAYILQKNCSPRPAAQNGRRIMVARLGLGLLALVLLVAGILNGGMRDVLVKAINICTECIGLG